MAQKSDLWMPSRRKLLKLSAAALYPAIAAPTVILAKTPAKLTFRDSGGPLSVASQEAFYKPFNEKFKGQIEVVGVAGAHEPSAQIRSIVETGNYIWDGADMSVSAALTSANAGHLAELNIDSDPNVKDIPAHFRTPIILGTGNYATVLAYRTDRFKEPVDGWAAFWDTTRFKGRRALRKHAVDTVEQALMAAGVPGSQLYPCDMDKAFASLDKIKSSVDVWWTGGAQVTQLLATGEVDMCGTWNTRAQAAIDSGAPVAISFDQGLFTYSGWTVIKGGKFVDEAREFVKFCAHPERQADFALRGGSAPCNTRAFDFIPAARGKQMPSAPENIAKMFPVDSTYWSKNQTSGLERFNAWLAR